jgi:hypothetical protein
LWLLVGVGVVEQLLVQVTVALEAVLAVIKRGQRL